MRALTHIKRITLSGLFMAFMLAMPAFASSDTEFYDINDNYIQTEYDGVNGAYNNHNLYVYSYDEGCAVIHNTTPPSGSTVYSCNGGCKRLSSPSYKIVNIVPNGSYFVGSGYNADDVSVSNTTFICDVSGKWIAVEATGGGGSTGCNENTMLRQFVTIRNYCGIGYHEETLGDCLDFLNHTAADFALDPYGYWDNNWDNIFSDAQRACQYTQRYTDGTTTTVVNYSGCASGYRLSGKSCISCGNLSGGGYNATDWHTNTQCTPYCNEGYGYKASTGTCEAGATNEYNMSNYGGEDYDFRTCPDGALCDGEYVYCPVGSFVFSAYDGNEPYCMDCPGQWGMIQASFNNKLQDCTGVSGGYPYDEWGQGYADTTDCLWTDATYDTPIGNCYEYMGSDNTGSYEFRQPDGDEWDYCYYEE